MILSVTMSTSNMTLRRHAPVRGQAAGDAHPRPNLVVADRSRSAWARVGSSSARSQPRVMRSLQKPHRDDIKPH